MDGIVPESVAVPGIRIKKIEFRLKKDTTDNPLWGNLVIFNWTLFLGIGSFMFLTLLCSKKRVSWWNVLFTTTTIISLIILTWAWVKLLLPDCRIESCPNPTKMEKISILNKVISPRDGLIYFFMKTVYSCIQIQDCIPVGCIPPARWPYLPVCSPPGGGVPAWSGVGVPGPGRCGIPACTEADPTMWTESQTPVKILPCPNFVAGGNYVKKHKIIRPQIPKWSKVLHFMCSNKLWDVIPGW